ncbi:unnamed protein product, partial [Scytosiphon promiscuus]
SPTSSALSSPAQPSSRPPAPRLARRLSQVNDVSRSCRRSLTPPPSTSPRRWKALRRAGPRPPVWKKTWRSVAGVRKPTSGSEYDTSLPCHNGRAKRGAGGRE